MGAEGLTAIEEVEFPGESTGWAGEGTVGLGDVGQRQRPRVYI